MKLRKLSLFSALVGALILTAAFAPSAMAVRELIYFNFEDGTVNSVPAPGPGGAYPFLQSTTITQPPANDPFPPGQFLVTAGVGTNLNSLANESTTFSALDLSGNTSAMGSTSMYCFQFSANTFTSGNLYTSLSLSFALNSIGNKGQFDTITLNYATVANPTLADFTQFYGSVGNISQGTGYYTITAALPAGAFQQPDLTLQFCLSGSGNDAVGNHTYIDNIRLTAVVVPEPSTYIGGMLGILGLCLFQRRWLVRSLRFRRA